MRVDLTSTQTEFLARCGDLDHKAVDAMGLGEAEAVLLAAEVGRTLGSPERIGTAPLRRLAYLVGVAERAIRLAVAYTHRHHQFDTPVADFQAVGFPLAAHQVRMSGWYWRLVQLATEWDHGQDVSVPDPLVRRHVMAAVSHAVHVHGATGLTDDNPVSACYRAVMRPLPSGDWPRRPTDDVLARRVPEEWTSPPARDLPVETVTGLFARAVARFADRTAVQMDRGGSVTYGELDARSNQLAHALQSVGVGVDSLVGVYLPRGIDLIVAMLGVLKAGGAFLSLDPEYPEDRIRMMVDDADAGVVVTQEALVEWLPESSATTVLVDAEGASTPIDDASGLAYLMYTSGSSGTPKGVEVEHRGLVNRLVWDMRQFGLGPDDAVLQHTSPNFDIAIWEIFAPLVGGARLVLARPGGAGDVDYLVEVLRTYDLTTLALVPSLLDVLLDVEPGLADVPSLRYVFSGGEALSPALCRRLFARMSTVELHNFYGPSEASIDATWWHCTPDNVDDGVPIGRPLTNVRVYILDDTGVPVPVGFTGELYVGGVGVARGYHRRPSLTAFLADPFVPGGRMYRTGDLARYRSDGAIEFLGRVDQQVKIRGFRVEPGEVESTLESNPVVRQALVLAEGERLAAYVSTFEATTPAALTAYLRDRLPEYLVPSVVTVVDEFPLMPNGKIDRDALRGARPVQASGGEVDEVVALMSQVLGTPEVGVEDDFFALGGTSLQAARFVTRARADLGLDLDLGGFVAAPTCAAVSRRRESG